MLDRHCEPNLLCRQQAQSLHGSKTDPPLLILEKSFRLLVEMSPLGGHIPGNREYIQVV